MTITVRLPDELEARLRARLDSEKIVLSDYVHRAIVEKLERDTEQNAEQAKPTALEIWQQQFGGWSSGEIDRAERVEEILRAKFDAQRRGRQ